MIEKYGKSYGDIESFKTDFLTENQLYLDKNAQIADYYLKQPLRQRCKLCNALRDNTEKFFSSHGVSYYICSKCNHVNGNHLETADFSDFVYQDSNYYDEIYNEKSKELYTSRVERIYVPKAEWMIECLQAEGLNVGDIHVLDAGAGSGYFVNALQRCRVDCRGIDISKNQVDYGNRMNEAEWLTCIPEKDIPQAISESSENVISFIGVLEHVMDIDEILQAVCKNSNIQYIYLSVPTLSYSVALEALTPAVFNRSLGGGHTHLFTEESLQYMYEKYGWDILGEWRFGTDIADFQRTMTVGLNMSGNHELANILNEHLSEVLDELQLVIDKSKFCSEIHVLVKKR